MRRSTFFIPIAAFAVLLILPHFAHAAFPTGLSPIINQGGACNCNGQTNFNFAPDWGCVVQTFQIVLNDFVYLATIVIVLYIAYAGFRMILSPTNAELRTQAKNRLFNAVIGLAIVLAAFLLVNSVMGVLYNGTFGQWNAILAPSTGSSNCIVMVQPKALPGISGASNAAGQGTTQAPGGATTTTSANPPPAGQVQSAICSAMNSYQGTNTSSGPGGGNVACAWSVNNILSNAGLQKVGSNPNQVSSVEQGLQGGRGTLIDQSQAQCGDVVIQANDGHVGICMNAGCTQVMSNSSSKATFSWVSNTSFAPSYSGGPGRIYRINN